MTEDRPAQPQPTAAPSQPLEAQPVASPEELLSFVVNESAYGQHLGLVNWNKHDRWYHGNGETSTER
jgi:hypothetical protein